jgi:hypothetical protein
MLSNICIFIIFYNHLHNLLLVLKKLGSQLTTQLKSGSATERGRELGGGVGVWHLYARLAVVAGGCRAPLPRSGSLVEVDLGGVEALLPVWFIKEHISDGCGGVLRRPLRNQRM